MPDRLNPSDFRPPPSTCPACAVRGPNPLEPFWDPAAPPGNPAGQHYWATCAACGHEWDAGGPPLSIPWGEGFGVAPPMEEET